LRSSPVGSNQRPPLLTGSFPTLPRDCPVPFTILPLRTSSTTTDFLRLPPWSTVGHPALARCVLGLSSSAKSVESSAKRATAQTPSFLSSRCAFSSTSKPSPPKGSAFTSGKPSGLRYLLPKLVIGTIVVGAAVGTAYQAGYIGNFQVKHEERSLKSSKSDVLNPTFKELPQNGAELPSKQTSQESPIFKLVEEMNQHQQSDVVDTNRDDPSEIRSSEETAVNSGEEQTAIKENEPSSSPQNASLLEKEDAVSEISSLDSVEMDNSVDLSNGFMEKNEITLTQFSPAEGTETVETPADHLIPEEESKSMVCRVAADRGGMAESARARASVNPGTVGTPGSPPPPSGAPRPILHPPSCLESLRDWLGVVMVVSGSRFASGAGRLEPQRQGTGAKGGERATGE
ncbi:hypothetical protein Taro_016734, partial [Colocasia esculenta]|nr:hypothetical protein [Colocasia esculenta]